MAQSGLSRRRVGTSTPTPNDGETLSSAPSPVGNSNGRTYGGGTALEGGGKVAYDPRDLETEGEGKSMPRLTILEEVLLLGIKDKQGYLSFWNDNISYALRGCIIMELALRRRIAMVKDSARRRYPLPDRLIEVIDERQTGETILDEALKMIKTSEKMGVGMWIDLMSGETWNVMKIGYQLKQYAASVLENALVRLGYDAREAALSRCDDILGEFSAWPFGAREGGAEAQQRRRPSSGDGSASIAELLRMARSEVGGDGAEDVSVEIISAVLEVFSRMDNLL
ncbi:unnamed protein product [Rhizoctonia solani]|uniref:Vacuolar protein sorting-associated protein 74 n=1 Tax=Rhizoctonia solani TaxID=456999 RepID=A0A8H3B652_9AGAM|nr:unnamed protein product [Rhizoctonia solani]